MMPAMAFAAEGSGPDAAGTETAEDNVVPEGAEQAAPEQENKEKGPGTDSAQGLSQKEAEGAEQAGTLQDEETAGEEQAETEREDTEDSDAEDALPAGETREKAFDAARSDYLAYDPLYIIRYANTEYVDVSEVDMGRFVNIVTAAKGIATYNVSKQNDFDVSGENYIAGMNYEMPVYNVDDDSKYYLAIPDVNLFNSGFKAYDIDVAYNNDFAEMISGCRYEKGILYIPKSAVDHPKNKSSVPEGALIAVQINYAIGDDMDFSKNIPVQVLKKDEPAAKTVRASNLFEQGISVSTGVRNRKTEDISVFLNGHMIPVNDSSWTYDKGSGELYIQEMPGVVSNINVVFRNRTVLETAKETAVSILEKTAMESYAAGITTDDLEFFRSEDGREVVLEISGGELFTGWRGHYKAAKVIHGRQGSQTHEQAEEAKKKLKGWANSVKYLYGGYTDLGGAGTSLIDNNAGKREFDARIAATWAISSYALGADAGLMNDDGKLTDDKLVTHNVPVAEGGTTTYNTTEKHTIYEWMMKYQNQLKKSNGSTTNNHNNGIAGATNFAVTFPDSIKGSSVSLVSEGENKGRANDTITITADSMDSSYYIAASCNHLDDVAASDNDTDIYVTCLSYEGDRAILAFAQARGGQNASAIYKFRLKGHYKTTVHKTDDKGAELAGVKLQILSGSSVIKEWTTGADAEVFEDIEPGTYTLREISAPYGYDLADDIQFTVAGDRDTVITMKNTPVTVKTAAVSAATGRHTGARKKNEKIVDSVHMTGLIKNRKYRLSGQLMNKRTGNAISGASVSREFTASGETMDVDLEFTFDSTALADGDSVVVYETLYRPVAVHGESVPAELGKHQDINDAAQTVIYPGISTTAADKASGTRSLPAGANAVIRDKVKYKGLEPGETYTVEGELYDKTSGSLTGINASAEFKAEASEGTVMVDFSFDSGSFKGHTLVVYESLKLDAVVIAEHRDPDDASQTLYLPKIGTKAAISDDNRNISDTVAYENLLPDQKYVVRGWLVDTASGTKIPGSDGKADIDGAKTTSGSVVVKMDASKFDEMSGSSITAFEELYIVVNDNGTDKEFRVAEHKDRSGRADTNPQTVGIFHDLKVRKNVTGNLGDLTKVFEYTAEFTGLEPGQAYRIEGDDEKTFMADSSGKASAAIRLKDGQTAVVRALPKGATYKVTEAASDHIAEYRIFSEDMADKGAKIIRAEDSNGADAGRILATAVETVDMFDGTVVILWENNRDLATLTGMTTYTGIQAGAFALVTAGLVWMLIRRKRYIRAEKHTFG